MLAREISVEGVRQKYSGANDAKERGDCIQHDNDPRAQRVGPNGTAPYTVKGIPGQADVSKFDDDFMQHAALCRAIGPVNGFDWRQRVLRLRCKRRLRQK
jgi:hypothetical protein